MLELSPCKDIVTWREQISARMLELMQHRCINVPIDSIVDIEVRRIRQDQLSAVNTLNVISLISVSGDYSAGYGGFEGSFDNPMLDVSYNSAYVNSSTQKFFIIVDSTELQFRDCYAREFDVGLQSLSNRIELILNRIVQDYR